MWLCDCTIDQLYNVFNTEDKIMEKGNTNCLYGCRGKCEYPIPNWIMIFLKQITNERIENFKYVTNEECADCPCWDKRGE